jgi:UDP-N-acetylmuramyl pentapeptide synthase
LKIALDFLIQQKAKHRTTLILSDILQSGLRSDEIASAVAKLTRDRKIDHLIAIGYQLQEHKTLFDHLKTSFFIIF